MCHLYVWDNSSTSNLDLIILTQVPFCYHSYLVCTAQEPLGGRVWHGDALLEDGALHLGELQGKVEEAVVNSTVSNPISFLFRFLFSDLLESLFLESIPESKPKRIVKRIEK